MFRVQALRILPAFAATPRTEAALDADAAVIICARRSQRNEAAFCARGIRRCDSAVPGRAQVAVRALGAKLQKWNTRHVLTAESIGTTALAAVFVRRLVAGHGATVLAHVVRND